jgi:hypothetical protein
MILPFWFLAISFPFSWCLPILGRTILFCVITQISFL